MPFGSEAVRLQALKGLFGSDAVSIGAAGTYYFALQRHSETPQTSLGAEPDSTGGYARVAVANADTEWTFSGAGLTNTNEVRWPVATDLYSIVDPFNQWAIYDNSAGGNVIAFGQISPAIVVTGAGDIPVIYAGDFSLTMDA